MSGKRKMMSSTSLEKIGLGREVISFNKAVEEFMMYCQLKDVKEKTLASYQFNFKVLKRALVDMDVPLDDVTNITEEIAIKLVFSFKEIYKASTTNHKLTIYKSFFLFLQKKKYIVESPFSNISHLKQRKQVKDVLTEAQIKKILNGLDLTSFIEFRNYVIILLLLDSGLRVNEACSLRVNDMYLDEDCLKVSDSKTGERIVPLSPRTRKSIQILLGERELVTHNFLFVTPTGKRFRTESFKSWLNIYSRKLGIHFSPHTFRRVFITRMVNKGINPLIIATMCGNSVEIIYKHYLNLSREDLKKAFNEALE